MQQLIIEPSEGYELIDSGNGLRLERFGIYTVVRPDPNVIWKPTTTNPAWHNPDLRFKEEAEGHWIARKTDLTQGWEVRFDTAKALIKPTPFRHVGIFPEQAANWDWIQKKVGKGMKVLNLFGYTGMSSIVAAKAGGQVTHVDASKGTVFWASENAKRSGVDSVRWIVDDALKFVQREVRRGSKYDLIILDPPVFGRGSHGEVWRLEEGLSELISQCGQLLADSSLGLVLNIYATALYPESCARLVHEVMPDAELYTLCLRESESGKLLQAGYTVRSKN